MTACLHYSPEREKAVTTIAQQIGTLVRAHRKGLRMTQPDYSRRYNIGRLSSIEHAAVPNFTLLMAVKLLELTGHELRIVPKGAA